MRQPRWCGCVTERPLTRALARPPSPGGRGLRVKTKRACGLKCNVTKRQNPAIPDVVGSCLRLRDIAAPEIGVCASQRGSIAIALSCGRLYIVDRLKIEDGNSRQHAVLW